MTNPFQIWAGLGRGLRDNFVAELGEQKPFSAYTGEILGMLAEMTTRCDHLGMALQRLQEHDAAAFDAFLRALERS